jgi:hypothetical protein
LATGELGDWWGKGSGFEVEWVWERFEREALDLELGEARKRGVKKGFRE